MVNIKKYSFTVIFFFFSLHAFAAYDYGDAPVSYGEAYHNIVTDMEMWNAPDSENSSHYSQDAMGDDNHGANNDELGIYNVSESGGKIWLQLVAGETIPIAAPINGKDTGKLHAWIDWNQDGDFKDKGEQVAKNVTPETPYYVVFDLAVPASAQPYETYARFRWSSDTDLGPTGEASDGEVEDYLVKVIPTHTGSCITGSVDSTRELFDITSSTRRGVGPITNSSWSVLDGDVDAIAYGGYGWKPLNGKGMLDSGSALIGEGAFGREIVTKAGSPVRLVFNVSGQNPGKSLGYVSARSVDGETEYVRQYVASNIASNTTGDWNDYVLEFVPSGDTTQIVVVTENGSALFGGGQRHFTTYTDRMPPGLHYYGSTGWGPVVTGQETCNAKKVVFPNAPNDPPTLTISNPITYIEHNKTMVVDLEAKDDSDSEGNGLTYNVLKSNDIDNVDRSLFVINSKTGVLAFKKSPNYETPSDDNTDNFYKVKIQICDTESGCSTKALLVEVLNSKLDDEDSDGLTEEEEDVLGTDSLNADTDGDGFSDSKEVNDTKTNPLKADSDNDGLNDFEEVNQTKTNPNKADSDGDGVKDKVEVGSDLTKPTDTDKDGIINALDKDDDNDSLLSKYEGASKQLDSDGDTISNYLDPDDDNDGIYTRHENPDPNGNGHPKDAQNTDGDALKDYLDDDDDNDQIKTIHENADPNGDHQPDDAKDSDGDTIADYLDASMDAVRLHVRGILSGAFSPKSKQMDYKLKAFEWFPKTQPYDLPKFANYKGTETLNSAVLALDNEQSIVDWVLVELRDKSDPTQIVFQKAALIQSDFDVIDSQTGSYELLLPIPAGEYYVALRHRNHLGVMTALPQALLGPTYLVDFSLSSTKTYGDHAQSVKKTSSAELMMLWAGNVLQDNYVIAFGRGNDASALMNYVLLHPDNAQGNTAKVLEGYELADTSLDGYVIAAGPDSDMTHILLAPISHPKNLNKSRNYIVVEQLP